MIQSELQQVLAEAREAELFLLEAIGRARRLVEVLEEVKQKHIQKVLNNIPITWPKLMDLPESERERFRKWMSLQSHPFPDEDSFYQVDYDFWKQNGEPTQ